VVVITEKPRDSLTQAHMVLARIPERYWAARYEDFPEGYDGVEAIGAYLDDLLVNVTDGVGVLLWGKAGHGKTHMAISILKKLLAHNATGLYLDAPGIQGHVIEKTALDVVQRPLIEVAKDVDMLVLDDFGAEHASSFSKVLVEQLIRSRGTRNKTTVITTNIPTKNIGAVYGNGLASVLLEYVCPVQINGKDWREDKQAEMRKRFVR